LHQRLLPRQHTHHNICIHSTCIATPSHRKLHRHCHLHARTCWDTIHFQSCPDDTPKCICSSLKGRPRKRGPTCGLPPRLAANPTNVVCDVLLQCPSIDGPTNLGGLLGCHLRPSWHLLRMLQGHIVSIPLCPHHYISRNSYPHPVHIHTQSRMSKAQKT